MCVDSHLPSLFLLQTRVILMPKCYMLGWHILTPFPSLWEPCLSHYCDLEGAGSCSYETASHCCCCHCSQPPCTSGTAEVLSSTYESPFLAPKIVRGRKWDNDHGFPLKLGELSALMKTPFLCLWGLSQGHRQQGRWRPFSICPMHLLSLSYSFTASVYNREVNTLHTISPCSCCPEKIIGLCWTWLGLTCPQSQSSDWTHYTAFPSALVWYYRIFKSALYCQDKQCMEMQAGLLAL